MSNENKQIINPLECEEGKTFDGDFTDRDFVGKRAVKSLFKGKFRHSTGTNSKRCVFDGEFGTGTGVSSLYSIFKNGVYVNSTGFNSLRTIISNGEYGDYTLQRSHDSIVVGGSFGKGIFLGASGIKAYVQKAESISSPYSGYIIADEVNEVKLSGSKSSFVYTTKDNVFSCYNNSAFILKSDLEEILQKVDFEHFKDIENHRTLSLAMDNLICMVDEASQYKPNK